ncbi:MAG: ParB/RepB/Spo0J family partition protein [Dysgonamonadaceae bacterium]|jgi:ParB family chromosome partitioning protein|nr:ParB/RepB/Spo0J family partition protein [Dysgonamonadaceae bacterium]
MEKKPKKPALGGQGIAALIDVSGLNTAGSSSINEIELSKIEVNPEQPRRTFNEESLEELAVSIRANGLIQPITLREIQPDRYRIISGERRFRASQKANLTAIPAYIRKASDENAMEMALIENIQREDLNAIEIALAFRTLIDTYNLTQEQLSERIGKKRATIANFLRLLRLPAEIQIGLKDGKIDMGHAKSLLSLDDVSTQLMVYEQILKYGFSVRRTEEIIKEIAGNADKVPAVANPKEGNTQEFKMLKEHLSAFFGTKVALSCDKGGKGKISISFANEQELERIVQVFDTLKNGLRPQS